MPPLSSRDILKIWERGRRMHDIDRALTTLRFANPGKTWDELTSLSVGERNRQLMKLREQSFGKSLTGFASCPRCQEDLQFRVSVAEFQIDQEPATSDEICLSVRGFELRARLPNSHDLAAAATCRDADSARATLISRCVTKASREETSVSPQELPQAVILALAEQLAKCDPQAVTELELTCAHCHFQWPEPLDIMSFFWAEIAVYAKRLLREVHVLASAYGWSESAILGLSPARRRLYLEMVG